MQCQLPGRVVYDCLLLPSPVSIKSKFDDGRSISVGLGKRGAINARVIVGTSLSELPMYKRIFKPTFRPRTNEMLHSFFPRSTRHFNKLSISIRESTIIYVLRRKLLHSIFFIITIILNYITLSCILLFQAPLLFPLIVLIILTYCSLVLALSYWNTVQL